MAIPNTLGIHALVWAGGWSKEECRTAIRESKEAGYGLIEIPALDPSAIDVPDTRAVLKDYDLKAAFSLGLSFDADINHEDEAIVRRGEERLLNALSVVEAIGGDYFGGVLYSALGKYPQPATEKARAHAVAALSRLAVRARDAGITLGLEPVNRYESNLVNTAAQAMAIIDEIPSDNVRVHLDVFHMNIEEEGMVQPVMDCASKLGYVHIGESHRGRPGTGTIDFDGFFSALARVQYRGVITFESFSSAILHSSLSNTLAIWRNTWTDNRRLAREAHAFMAGHIERAWAASSGILPKS